MHRDKSAPRRRRPLPIQAAPRGPVLAVIALLLATLAVLLFNQHHSGDPLKVRRELRKF